MTQVVLHYAHTFDVSLLYSVHCLILHSIYSSLQSLCMWSPDPMDIFDPPDRETMRLQKFGKLLAGPNTDLGQTNFHNLFCEPCSCPPLAMCTFRHFFDSLLFLVSRSDVQNSIFCLVVKWTIKSFFAASVRENTILSLNLFPPYSVRVATLPLSSVWCHEFIVPLKRVVVFL